MLAAQIKGKQQLRTQSTLCEGRETSCLVCMQDKLLRTLVLTCLCRTITTYLLRLSPRLPQDKISRWLNRATKPILLNLRKGNFGFPEQQVSLA